MNVLDTFSLRGKVALVTGGAGLYGRQITEALAQAGARTYIASRNREQSEKLADEFRKLGLDVEYAEFDQSDEASIARLERFLFLEVGRVHILVNNAVLRPMANWSSPADDFAKSMEANATGIFMMTRTFGEHMAERGGGSIINIGSIQGSVGPDFSLYEGLDWETPPDYFFHKGGMLNFSRFAAAKLGSRNVRVNVISPGGFFANQDPRFVERYKAKTMLGRMANSTDLQGAVVFLASDASTYITGANLFVDGGYTAM
ncbi:MAG TPA: SDR family oxidoreductase [Lacipirellulaceae bacterium]|nr:SDR family oxidoreductase [Lacipirellulaceae bacterium]